jgi:hypothetical protein
MRNGDRPELLGGQTLGPTAAKPLQRPPEKIGTSDHALGLIQGEGQRVSIGGGQGGMMTPGDLDLRLSEQIRTLFEVGSLGTLPDGQLLDRFSSGDAAASEPAFGMLVERHGPMVLGVSRRLLADPHLAEDAFQATFLVLARRSGTAMPLEGGCTGSSAGSPRGCGFGSTGARPANNRRLGRSP